MRVWVVGLGTVGSWVLHALHCRRERLAERYGCAFTVVGAASRREGFVYDAAGLEIPGLLDGAVVERPGVGRWSSAIEGLRATDADVLVEVTGSPAADGEPGYAHMREALGRGIPVVTSNKWPVALHGVELAELARSGGVALRAESTVMSGTPVLGPLVEGLAGATPVALRGILNATANFILTRMSDGRTYAEALGEAQQAGLAERDPSADVEGEDSVAKLMILAALVFGRQLRREDVICRGITDVGNAAGGVRHLATLEFAEPDGVGEVKARVEPSRLPADDPLASVDGTTNAVVVRATPLGTVTIAGPGAGPELAGQGVLSDLIRVAVSAGSRA